MTGGFFVYAVCKVNNNSISSPNVAYLSLEEVKQAVEKLDGDWIIRTIWVEPNNAWKGD